MLWLNSPEHHAFFTFPPTSRHYHEAIGAIVTDPTFSCTARFADQALSQFVPAFAYEFNDTKASELVLPPMSIPYGVAHASELQYLFKLRAAFPALLNASQPQLSDAMISYWTQFAKTSNPNSSGTPSWPQCNAGTDQFQALVPPSPEVESDFATEDNCALWGL